MMACAAEEAAIVAELPGYIRTLAGNGYTKRAFYFEIVECARKLLIVCVPVFFQPSGSTHQLLFALLVTFLISCSYSTFLPYRNDVDNQYALAAQAIIFFNLLASVAQPLSVAMDVVLTFLLISFMVLAALLSAKQYADPHKEHEKDAKRTPHRRDRVKPF